MAELFAQQAEREASYEELDCFKQSVSEHVRWSHPFQSPFVDAPDQNKMTRRSPGVVDSDGIRVALRSSKG